MKTFSFLLSLIGGIISFIHGIIIVIGSIGSAIGAGLEQGANMGLGKSSYAEGMKKASEAGDAASYLLLAGILLVLAAIFSFIGGGLTKSKKKAGWILNAVCVLITGAAYYFQLQGENGSIVIWLIIFSLAMVLSFFSAKASEKIG